MKKGISDSKSDLVKDEKLKEKSTNFVAKVDRDAQDAVIRNLYIPKALRDKIKKPGGDRSM